VDGARGVSLEFAPGHVVVEFKGQVVNATTRLQNTVEDTASVHECNLEVAMLVLARR